MKKNTRPVVSLNGEITKLIESPSVQAIITRFVKGYKPVFHGDTATIRSLCHEAVMKAVRAYSGKRQRKPCLRCKGQCSHILRAAVRTMRNDIFNALNANRAQKRGGAGEDGNGKAAISEPFAESFEYDGSFFGDDLEGFGGSLEPKRETLLDRAAKEAFRLGSPLQRAINNQIADQIKAAHRRLTVPQSTMLRLALDPTSRVRTRARDLESAGVPTPFLRAAQEAVKGTDFDRLAVEGVVREILSL